MGVVLLKESGAKSRFEKEKKDVLALKCTNANGRKIVSLLAYHPPHPEGIRTKLTGQPHSFGHFLLSEQTAVEEIIMIFFSLLQLGIS